MGSPYPHLISGPILKMKESLPVSGLVRHPVHRVKAKASHNSTLVSWLVGEDERPMSTPPPPITDWVLAGVPSRERCLIWVTCQRLWSQREIWQKLSPWGKKARLSLTNAAQVWLYHFISSPHSAVLRVQGWAVWKWILTQTGGLVSNGSLTATMNS